MKYIQEAMIQLFCKDFGNNDPVLLFLTDKAKRMNFLDNGQYNRNTGNLDLPNVGLKTKLDDLTAKGFTFELIWEPISEGFSEDEIWSIFETVADQIEEGDEIIMDITHAFRFLPMLGVVLLNYLKTTKNITVKGIHYGAFEKLGSQAEVKKLNIKDRNAPIINLDTLLAFQSWTSAVNSFVKFGEVKELNETSKPDIQKFMRESHGADQVTKDLRHVIDQLSILNSNLQTNRLNLLLDHDFTTFQEKIDKLPETEITIKPFKQILKLIEKKVSPIVTSRELIWLESSKWCLEHNLVQQAYTQLQEGLLTYLMQCITNILGQSPSLKHLFQKQNISTKIDIKDKDQRQFYGSLSYFIYYNAQDKTKSNSDNFFVNLANQVSFYAQSESFIELCNCYGQINKPRNDINHAGMTNETMAADKLKKKINELVVKIENAIK